MKERIKGRSTVAPIRKARRFNQDIRVIGRMGRERFERLPDGSCGKKLGEDWAENTILAFDVLIELVAGTRGSHLNAAFSAIRIKDTATGTPQYDNLGTDAGPTSVTATQTDGRRIRWSFHDDTATARSNLNWAELWNGDPANPATGAADGGTCEPISRVNTAFGNKPTTENWRYHYEVEMYSADADIEALLNTHWMDLITGASADHLTTANVRIQPKDGANAAVGSTIGAGSRVVGANYLEYTFVSADGQNNGTWANVAVQRLSGTWADMRYGPCKQDGSSCGTKAAGEEWTWTWRYTLS